MRRQIVVDHRLLRDAAARVLDRDHLLGGAESVGEPAIQRAWETKVTDVLVRALPKEPNIGR